MLPLDSEDAQLDKTEDQNEIPLKRRHVVSPWKDMAEFRRVYDALYANTANEQTWRSALSTIRVWKIRRSLLCPAGVLATAVIVDMKLKDDNSERCTLQELRTLYASTFNRFYNFMSSIMQTHNLRTMYETARELGLHSFVVDLRHLCAHGQVLPPIELMRRTADYCLDWLHTYYWCGQLENMREVNNAGSLRRKGTTELEVQIGQLFNLYDYILECHMGGATNVKLCKRHLHGKRFAALKNFAEQRKMSELHDIRDVLLRELATFIHCEGKTRDLQEVYVEAVLKMKYFLTTAASPLTNDNHSRLIAATQGLFRLLAINGCIESLFQTLLRLVEETSAVDSAELAVRRICAAFWALKIAEGFVAFRRCKKLLKEKLHGNPDYKEWDLLARNVDQGPPKQVRQLFVYAGVNMQRTLLFGDSQDHPWVWLFGRDWLEERLAMLNKQSQPILKCLLPLVEPSLTEEELVTLNALLSAFCNLEESSGTDLVTAKKTKKKKDKENKHEPFSARIYTAEDIEMSLNGDTLKDTDAQMSIDSQPDMMDQGGKSFGAWTLPPVDVSHNWGRCPLGRLPWD